MIRKISSDTLRSSASTTSFQASQTVTPSGGNEVKLINGFYYHVFTSSSNFFTGFLTNVELTMFAGGGGGGNGTGGGGGAGGWMPWRQIQVTPYINCAVTIGAEGNGGNGAQGNSGGDTTFVATNGTLTVVGGGGAGFGGGSGTKEGRAGGCGGGAATRKFNNGGNFAPGKASGIFMGTSGGWARDESNNAYGAGGGGGVIGRGGDTGGTGGEGANISTYLGVDVTTLSSFSGMNVLGSGGGGSTINTNLAGGTGGGSANAAATTLGSGGGGGNNSSTAGKSGVLLIRWKA